MARGRWPLVLGVLGVGILCLGPPACSPKTPPPKSEEHFPALVNPAAKEALRPRLIPPTPSAYEATPKEALTSWVAKLNGDPIARAFFLRRLAANRSSAYIKFAGARSAAGGAEFWTTKQGGETPAQWLLRRTLEECLRLQMELQLAKREEIIPETSYAGFLKALDRENERRRAALARGEPIYGPEQYREDEFFIYRMNNLRLVLQRQLGRAELKPSEEALKETYEAIKHRHFNRGYRVRIWAIQMMIGSRDGYAPSYPLEEARARAREAKRRVEAGERFEEVAAEYNDDGELQERVFDYESRSLDKAHHGVMREEAMALSEGEVSDVFQELNAFYLLKCLEKDFLGYRPLAEVREQVVLIYLRREYEALVTRLVKSASVKLNQAELDRTVMQ